MFSKSSGGQGKTPKIGTASSPMTRNRRNTVAVLMKAKTIDNFESSMQSSQLSSSYAQGPSPASIEKDLLANGISEKDLEIEHLVTQVIALTEKADVIEDMRKDIQSHKEMFQESESKREEMQLTLQDTSETVKADADKHKDT
jgi:hypothetical protein